MTQRLTGFCANPECGERFETNRSTQRYCCPEHRPNYRGPDQGPRLQYGPEHRRLRAELAPVVDAGEAYCAEPVCLEEDRWIEPGSEWHLAHDREAGADCYRGPAHARCNRTEGARYLEQLRAGQLDAAPANRWEV